MTLIESLDVIFRTDAGENKMSKVIEIRKLLELLEEVKKRPRMFFYPPGAQSALNYLFGFSVVEKF